ncbi:Sir2 family NAD-dependent protein deacetylase [Methanobrevibacter filiformis]|uniref:NAD-dependent protein deacetylase n=1 Tax=Methanobrevibacter filiformis TaxID=55758 RepID=A0A166BZV4_9EURY|nr:Sir2 family NAD-dependent protein deacetylase [Methanobrevibacter filiformis]KZX13984.1 NAD-dependent protein deacetylase [Methanobrevibacter filiformis]
MTNNKLISNKIKKFKELIENSENILFFGGAGVSIESGIPDFRSEKGILKQ